jgi:IMP dehydrogenase/GMP reductase
VSTASRLTPGIELAIPDRVGRDGHGHRGPPGIAIARAGGIGIVHRNPGDRRPGGEVDKVKRSQSA